MSIECVYLDSIAQGGAGLRPSLIPKVAGYYIAHA
jgi:hypothetical protein